MTTFSVAFFGAGFATDAITPLAMITWDAVISIPPFDFWEKTAVESERNFSAYYDPEPLEIDFQFDGKRLVVPAAQRIRLLERIRQRSVPSNLKGSGAPAEWTARSVWEPPDRWGEHGK